MREMYDLFVQNRMSPVKVTISMHLRSLIFCVMEKMVTGKRSSRGHEDEEGRSLWGVVKEMLLFFAYAPSHVHFYDLLTLLERFDSQDHFKAVRRVGRELDLVLAGLLVELRRKHNPGDSCSEPQDFIDALLAAMSKMEKISTSYITDTTIKAIYPLLIIAGKDSISIALVWFSPYF
ncbi:cytochrome P450 82C4-like [Amborella trichopoda]|uniref:cytochrome P450 82C4-like n=1 Tax=Amborella trichopoda TaxID=13333 RepID=UPI0009C0EFE9|nr:cytochrome P450 82C4-like [Amborella trichopoda]|eukprot:XP_020530190.1 cytochrome P450 82C4-like [Amborella trichopoda]